MPLYESIVAVVLNPNFGERLMDIARLYPIWVIRSKENNPAIEQARQNLADTCDVTSFQSSVAFTPEEEFLGMLDTIDLHHLWGTLKVLGCVCTSEIRAELQQLGVVRIDEYDDYFDAHRPESEK